MRKRGKAPGAAGEAGQFRSAHRLYRRMVEELAAEWLQTHERQGVGGRGGERGGEGEAHGG